MLEQKKSVIKRPLAPQCQKLTSSPDVLVSSDLLGNSKMIIIRHAGEEYRLSITSKDKLILTK